MYLRFLLCVPTRLCWTRMQLLISSEKDGILCLIPHTHCPSWRKSGYKRHEVFGFRQHIL
ncbi:unnamed protein product [Brassica rapa]|uniref:Uncharacterized protein n=2 Tax=Brassica TaxID=3705 RepID=A0A8D9HXX6_BRACM|nr:unnamed protein product [Brassica napus]CAG7906887.1 unnamed protein product [Brassica rapa]